VLSTNMCVFDGIKPTFDLFFGTGILTFTKNILAVPYLTLPFLEIDGIRIGQSIAVARYLAKKAGLTGKSLIEESLAERIVDFVSDYRSSE